jgi:radical SAM protein with 4Fe4S-binding SPASM domain
MKRPKGVMKPEVHRSIMDKVKTWGAPIALITHAGLGEPLLDSGLEQKIVREKKAFPTARVFVYTNGSLLNENRARALIESGLDVLSVSINGFRKETYESVMKLSREKTYQNVETFLSLNRSLDNPVEVNISLIKTDFCSSTELQEFTGYWSGKVNCVVTPPWISWGNHFTHTIKGRQFPCAYIFSVLMIDWDGTVKRCCEDYDTRYPLGNILQTSPAESFNSPSMQQQRAEQLKGIFEHPEICMSCVETFDVAKDFWKNSTPVPV